MYYICLWCKMWWQLYLWTRLRARYLVWSCIRWFIGTLPDRPRDYTVWSMMESSIVDSRTWAGVIQVDSATKGLLRRKFPQQHATRNAIISTNTIMLALVTDWEVFIGGWPFLAFATIFRVRALQINKSFESTSRQSHASLHLVAEVDTVGSLRSMRCWLTPI
jgi:hypothetical protein